MKVERGIFKNKKGYYDVRVATHVRSKFVRHSQTNLKTIGEARRIKQEFDGLIANQRKRIRNGVVTWELAVQEYLAISESKLAASTVYTQKCALLAHTKNWNDLFLDELYRDKIEREVNAVLDGKTDQTKNHLLKYIRNVFRVQMNKGAIAHNPANGISFGGRKKRKRLEAMTQSEVKYLLLKAKEYNHEWFEIWYLIYMTGIRPMEGYVLSWSDIDFENHFIHITKTWCSKSKMIKEPKDGDARIVPMSKNVYQFLLELKARRGNAETVLPQLKSWRHGDGAKILRSFQRDIGIKETDLKSLRASFITHSLLANVPLTKVKEIVGHASLKTTAKHYVRLSGSDLRGAGKT